MSRRLLSGISLRERQGLVFDECGRSAEVSMGKEGRHL
jgi:hypothetical protein